MAQLATQNFASPLSEEIGELRRSRPIDLVHLAKQSLGDPMLEQEILRMFDQVVQVQQERVMEARDPVDVTEGLHALKGASAGVGAMGVHQQAKAAEHEYGVQGQLSAECLSDLDIAIAEVRHFIEELLVEDA